MQTQLPPPLRSRQYALLMEALRERQQAEEQSERVHRYERSYGVFERTFSLPTTVDPERIDASYTNGILTVTIPKSTDRGVRRVDVS